MLPASCDPRHPLLPDSSSAAWGVEKVPNPTGVVTTTRITVAVFMVASDPRGVPARSLRFDVIAGTLGNFTVKIKWKEIILLK